MAHTYDPTYKGSRHQADQSLKPAMRINSLTHPNSTIPNTHTHTHTHTHIHTHTHGAVRVAQLL
jgi:hypothetical protein